MEILDETICEIKAEELVLAEFQRRLVQPIAETFLPVFQDSAGTRGFVSIQGDPVHEEDPDVIIREALENQKVSPNICCKIPTTRAGLLAMEYLISKDIPLNATEIFAIRQAVVLCETYRRASRKHGKSPQLYISHIAGIYDDYLQGIVKKEGIEDLARHTLAGRAGDCTQTLSDHGGEVISRRLCRRGEPVVCIILPRW